MAPAGQQAFETTLMVTLGTAWLPFRTRPLMDVVIAGRAPTAVRVGVGLCTAPAAVAVDVATAARAVAVAASPADVPLTVVGVAVREAAGPAVDDALATGS